MHRSTSGFENAFDEDERRHHETQLTRLLARGTTDFVGPTVGGRIGADDDGWREDWSLIEISDTWAVHSDNDRWWRVQAIHIEKVFKDGCRRGVTGGVVDGNKVLRYYKNNINLADPQREKPALIDGCEHKLLWPIEGQYMVLPGDSGSVVLARGEEGLDFVGGGRPPVGFANARQGYLAVVSLGTGVAAAAFHGGGLEVGVVPEITFFFLCIFFSSGGVVVGGKRGGVCFRDLEKLCFVLCRIRDPILVV
jgi:hypothetical protein